MLKIFKNHKKNFNFNLFSTKFSLQNTHHSLSFHHQKWRIHTVRRPHGIAWVNTEPHHNVHCDRRLEAACIRQSSTTPASQFHFVFVRQWSAGKNNKIKNRLEKNSNASVTSSALTVMTQIVLQMSSINKIWGVLRDEKATRSFFRFKERRTRQCCGHESFEAIESHRTVEISEVNWRLAEQGRRFWFKSLHKLIWSH